MTFGEKLADAMASVIGSWRFIGIQTCTILFWLLLNTRGSIRPDPYPFILLNLLLSFQAAYTGPVLLMSANRQAEVDRKRAIENLEIDRTDHAHIHSMLHKIKAIEEDIETAMRLRPETSKTQPDWSCNTCGEKWGRWWENETYTGPTPHFATYHIGKCDICGETKAVTEARDFGYLRKGWDRKITE
jgi:uncharacterized membrane protein